MRLNIHTNLLLKLTAGFIIATVAGTMLHEGGHCVAVLPFAAPGSVKVDYGSMRWDHIDNLEDSVYDLDTIAKKTPAQQQEFERLFKQYLSRELQGRLGGPVSTILIGLAGLLLVVLFIKQGLLTLSFTQWLYIFISLFWLRPVYIFLSWLPGDLFGRKSRADEVVIAEMLQIKEVFTIVPAGLIGIAVAVWIYFTRIPVKLRQTFLVAMILGCLLGFVSWFYLLGPAVLSYT